MGEPPGGDMLLGFPVLDQDHETDPGIEGFDVAAVAILLLVEASLAALELGEVHWLEDSNFGRNSIG
jgi:hypothetical protein